MDVNVDVGESFGRYVIGNDEAVMRSGATSVSVATCFHAGDPTILHATVALAKKYSVAVGAHVGLDDRRGFGRRRVDISGNELYADTVYQLGAALAVCKVNGIAMQHVKAHGILYRMVTEEKEYVEPFLQAISDIDRELYVLAPGSTLVFERGTQRGMNMVAEVAADLDYNDAGDWVIERVKKERSPEEVAAQAVSVATEGRVPTVTGQYVDIAADTISCHGDAPNADIAVRCVVDRLRAAGVEVKSFL